MQKPTNETDQPTNQPTNQRTDQKVTYRVAQHVIKDEACGWAEAVIQEAVQALRLGTRCETVKLDEYDEPTNGVTN